MSMGCMDSLEPKWNSPAEQRACGFLLQATCSCLLPRGGSSRPHGCRCRDNFQPEQQTASWSRSLHKGPNAPGHLVRALNTAQKGTGGIIPQAASWSCSATNQRRTLAPAAPQHPEQHGWAVPCSEQLQASSAQQMNYHQSKCYLTRFILCVFLLHSHHTKHSKKNIA